MILLFCFDLGIETETIHSHVSHFLLASSPQKCWENIFGLRNLNISNILQVIEICIVIPKSSAHVFVRTISIYKFVSNVNFIFSAKPYHVSAINNFVSVFTLKGSKCTYFV